ncbi:MAG: Calx-beta domain-containing protein [Candidatus Cryptobacteroides sp.]
MKSLYRIFAIAAAVSFVAACNPNTLPEFDDKDAFAAFEKTSYSVDETIGTMSVPVTIASVSPMSASVTYEVDAEKSTAVEGVDYTLVDKTGVISFSGSERTNAITVKVLDHSGVYTGDKVLVINIKSAVGVNVGAENSCTIKILDLDHPLADILGTYTVTCQDYANGALSYEMSLTKDPEDVNLVWCEGIVPLAVNDSELMVWGTVSADHKTITFTCGQKPGANWGYGDMVLCTWELTSAGFEVYVEGSIVFTKQEDGTFTSENSIAFVDDYYIYRGGLLYPGTVWTKK